MTNDPIEADFSRFLQHKKRGGVPLSVGVSRGVWMGGMHEVVEHEPFVFIGPADWEGGEELTFLSDRDAVESLIQRLRIAAKEAWGDDHP